MNDLVEQVKRSVVEVESLQGKVDHRHDHCMHLFVAVLVSYSFTHTLDQQLFRHSVSS